MKKVKIEAKNIWKSYGSLQVLKGLDLSVYEGETLVILGRSGVGKSVLLKQIIALERPERGEIFVEGESLFQLKRSKQRRLLCDMGMLFQGAALFDSMNVGENVGFCLAQHGKMPDGRPLSRGEIRSRVAEALEMVNLAGTEEKMPSELSGGMRKRAALARLIVYRPHVLLYDEPTTGLDPITCHQINELIVKIQQELKATSLVVTHDIKSAVTVGTRLALHEHGKIGRIAPRESFFDTDQETVRSFLENAALDLRTLKQGVH